MKQQPTNKNRKHSTTKAVIALCLAAFVASPTAAFAANDAQDASLDGCLATISSALSRSATFDIAGASTANCSNLQLWSANTTPAQRFALSQDSDGYYTIKNVNSGKVLDVSGGTAASGTNVQQYAANNTKAQKWSLIANPDGTYTFKSALSSDTKNLVLDVSGANAGNGGNLQLWSSNSTNAQKFNIDVISPVLSNGEYTVGSQLGTRVADISGGSNNNGANLQLWDANNTLAQKFKFTYDAKTGYYTIQNSNSGKVLDVSGGSDANGANVQQYVANNTKAQKWSITKNADGTFKVASAVGGKVLDVSGAANRNGANIQTWQNNGTAAQKWNIKSSSTAGDTTETKPTPETASYQIAFKYLDANGNWKTDTLSVKQGSAPAIPTVAQTGTVASSNQTFTFTGWDASPVAATGNCTYTAQYTYADVTKPTPEAPKTCTVTFKYMNQYGTWDTTEVIAKEGEKPVPPSVPLTGVTNSGNYEFTFTGWDTDLQPAEQLGAYTAQYSLNKVEAKTYDITLNYRTKTADAAQIIVPYKQGQTPLHVDGVQDSLINQEILLDSVTLDISPTSKVRYTFVEWDKPLAPVTQTESYTALYKTEYGTLQNGNWTWLDFGTA